MLPLAGSGFPDSPTALSAAIEAGFEHYGLKVKTVRVEGGQYPEVDSLNLDLTGAEATRSQKIPKPGKLTGAALKAGALEIQASPLLFEGTPIRLHLAARNVELQHSEAGNDSLLSPVRASDGSIEIEISRADLEKLLHTIATTAAASHGVEIRETHIQFTSRGPRALSFQAEIVAKVFFVKAPVTFTGDAAIDDDLNLHLSNLATAGSGVGANLASSFLKPQFDKLQSKPIPFAVLELGEIKLRDVEVAAGESLRLQAKFGSA